MASPLNPDDDRRHNPGEWDESAGRRLQTYEDDASVDDDAPDESSEQDANTDQARRGEEDGNKLIPSVRKPTPEAVKAKGHKEAEKDERGNRRDKVALNFMKKKGPLGLIGVLLAGGGGIFTALLSPGLAIVQLKEALMDDLNDAVSAMDVRSQHIFRAKMKDQVGGVCTKKVTVRCKFKGMSKTQVKKLAKAGIEVETSPNRRSLTNGKYKITKMSYYDSAGQKKTVTASEFKDLYRNNPEFRSKMNTFYSSKWYSIRGPDMDSVKNKFKLSFKRLINGKNKEEMRQQVNRTTTEGASERDGRRVTVETREVNGEQKKVYVQEDGSILNDSNGNPIDPDREEAQISKLKKLADTGTGKMLTTGLKAASIYTGTQEVACSVLSMLRTAGIAARNLKFAQAMRYATPFLNTADSIKAGTATVEATSFVGDILTHQDMREMILTDDSLPVATDSSGKKVLDAALDQQGLGGATISPTPNPYKGKDAFDAPMVKASMDGTTSNIGLRESLTSLSGAMGSTMVALVDDLRKLPGVSESSCAFWKNPIVQGAGFILSVATIAVTCVVAACSGAAVSVAKAVATTAVSILVTKWVASQIQDLVDGKMFSADSEGYDAGGGIATGTAALGSVGASAKGMTPLSTPEEIRERDLVAKEYQSQDIAMQRYEARDTPYDIYNEYSFLGSIAWSVTPIVRDSSGNLAAVLSVPLQLLGSVPSWFAPKANALVSSGPERYEKCDDEVYSRINLKSADMMCNLRWGMSDAQLNSDPNKVVEWMIDSCQVDPVSGEVNPTGVCNEGCKPGQPGTEQCSRATTTEEALAMLSSTPNQVANAMSYDDEGVDQPVAKSEDSVDADKTAYKDLLPPGMTTPDAPADAKEAVKDVRTYAHFLRYCRYGPEEGARTVNFGDPDGEDNKNVLSGLDFQLEYSSVGKECLTSNNCDPNNPAHADPNSAFSKEYPDEMGLQFCRPPQYDIYAVYTMDQAIEAGMEQEEEGEEESSDGLVTGEAKELACKVGNEPNIELVEASKTALKKFCETGEATNACGEKYGINPLLTGVMLTLAKKWKMKVNNFGFKEDRSFCDSSPMNQHRMGNAIDLNGLEKVGGGTAGDGAWGGLNYSGGQTALVTEFATEWMDALATKEPTRGRSGQLGCGGYNLISIKKPNWEGIDGLLHFDDSCDHLHIDVGDRVDQGKR